jgi:hypothetical protein
MTRPMKKPGLSMAEFYDPFGQPDKERNYYVDQYFPKSELMPGPGEPIRIKVVVVK